MPSALGATYCRLRPRKLATVSAKWPAKWPAWRWARMAHHLAADVALPAFDLNCSVNFGEASGAQDAGDVDAFVAAERGNLDSAFVKAHFDEQLADERFEAVGGHGVEQAAQFGEGLMVDALYLVVDAGRLPLGQAKDAAPLAGTDEGRAILLGLGVEPGTHGGLGREAGGLDETGGQSSLGDGAVVEGVGGLLEDLVGGVQVGHGFPLAMLLRSCRGTVGGEGTAGGVGA
jgi:hypothetical protein